jgi:hypothetical protein
MSLTDTLTQISQRGVIATLNPYDLVAVKANGIIYYCFFVTDTDTILAYPGEAGYATFLKSFADSRDEGTPLKEFNRKIEQDVLVICPGEKEPVMEKRPLHDPHPPKDPSAVENLLSVLLSGVDAFARWKDKEGWMKDAGVGGAPEDVAPLVGEDGSVSPLFVKDIDISFTHDVATITDFQRLATLRRNRQKETTVLYAAVFVCPIPLGDSYPFVQVLFDKTRHTPVDAMMISDYAKEHVTFVEHFLSYCQQKGVPAAMHAMDERSYYLYKDVCQALGMMITLPDRTDTEMDEVCEGYVQAAAAMVSQSMEDHHHHDHDHHDHESE